MANFDQRNQNVHTQYNADTITIGEIHTSEDCLAAIKILQAEALKAIKAKVIEGEAALELEFYLNKAVLHAEQPPLKKSDLIQNLNKAKELVGGVSGLVVAIGNAVKMIGELC
jgi:hypothetical protein